MSKYQLTIAFFLLFTLSGCAILPPKLPSAENIQTTSDLDEYLKKIVALGDPPGLTLVVTKNNKVIYEKGFGFADKPRHKLALPESVYQWWSLTKPVTAVAILQLNEQKKLNLNDPVDKYIPFFNVTPSNAKHRKVQIKDLLSHSSGLGDIGMKILGWIHYDGDLHVNQTTLLEDTFSDYSKLKYVPGSEGHYSNFGYLVLAAIIEKVSGISYENYIRTHVLKPLGMHNTDFFYSNSMIKAEATGSHPVDLMSWLAFFYIDKDRAIREKTNGRYWFNHVYSDQNGPTGLIGPATDFSKLLMSLINKNNENQVLTEESIALMFSPVTDVTSSPAGTKPNLKFALGWFYYEESGRVFLTHAGAGAAFVCMARIYPEESLSMVVMANSTYFGRIMGEKLLDQVANIQW